MQATPQGIYLSASDLANYLGCRHLTESDRAVVEGRLEAPEYRDPDLELLQKRGLRHEEAYLGHLQSQGRLLTRLADGSGKDDLARAMAAGADVIVQASLASGRWHGRADVLLKVARASSLGNWSYEVVDTKLARRTRAASVLQLCLYSELVGEIQGAGPEFMHVIKPGSMEPETFRFEDFGAYYRLVKRRLEDIVGAPPADTYPIPVAKCDSCRWREVCDTRWHNDDHPSLIAGIRSGQTLEIQRQGMQTLEAFADATEPLPEAPARGSLGTYGRLQLQARIQLRGRREGRLLHELRPIVEGEGLCRLPEPDDGDLFLDIEADAFVGDHGLEYLLGVAWLQGGSVAYKSFQGLSIAEEKQAFEALIDFITERRRRYPNLHIYHFSYDAGALKRLMARHGTRELELDALLRSERFVDLLAVTRQGLRASVESYSLKKLEPFFGFRRKVPLEDARRALRNVEWALELDDLGRLSEEDLAVVEGYNREDCLALVELRDWFESIRQEAISQGQEIPRPIPKSEEATEKAKARAVTIQRLYDGLVEALPADRSDWGDKERARWLLAHLVGYFSREEKVGWWEFFRLRDLEAAALHDERKAVSGIKFVSTEGGTAKCPIHRYRFPKQEVSLGDDDALEEPGGRMIGSVASVNLSAGTIDIKKRGDAREHHPDAVFSHRVIPAGSVERALHELAEQVMAHETAAPGELQVGRDLLLKVLPRLASGSGLERLPGEDKVNHAIRLVRDLDGGILPIQGPPGTGKTHTGAEMVVALLKDGKRVGVTAVGHKVIRNFLEKAVELGDDSVRTVHRAGKGQGKAGDSIWATTNDAKALAALDDGCLVGGTAWFWTKDDAASTLDYLFVDEAGQMALAPVLAASRAARNVVLLGDPQQLEQPQKGTHPEGAEVAALVHLLDGHDTMPAQRGLFLEETWRLHPKICRFTSELYYENRLRSKPGLDLQSVRGDATPTGSGLYFVPVPHHGNRSSSAEECGVVAGIIDGLLGHTWVDQDEKSSTIGLADILVVAPYNAQVAALRQVLPQGAQVGTVDAFQGQEAPVVIYSLAASTAEEAPRGMEFLFSPNRLNVATSRARCLSIVVASRELIGPDCRTVEQMRWANGICRFVEMASWTTTG